MQNACAVPKAFFFLMHKHPFSLKSINTHPFLYTHLLPPSLSLSLSLYVIHIKYPTASIDTLSCSTACPNKTTISISSKKAHLKTTILVSISSTILGNKFISSLRISLTDFPHHRYKSSFVIVGKALTNRPKQ